MHQIPSMEEKSATSSAKPVSLTITILQHTSTCGHLDGFLSSFKSRMLILAVLPPMYVPNGLFLCLFQGMSLLSSR